MQLGVDPGHAKLLVDAAKTASRLFPLAAVKASVLAGLQTGLASLSFLRSSHILGDFRVNAVRRIVEKGESLRLIFPEEDMSFIYSTASSSSSFSSNDGLICGKRIPHVWFSTSANDATAIFSSLELVDLRFYVLFLPAEIQGTSDEQRILVEANKRVGDNTPPKIIRVISVAGDDSTQDRLHHDDLQALFQRPNLTWPEPTRRRQGRELMRCSPTGNLDTVIDVTGEWRRLARSGADLPLAVCIRPDGHVASLLSIN